MSKLKVFIEEDLFERIKTGKGEVWNLKAEKDFIPPLMAWYEKCKHDDDITHYNDVFIPSRYFLDELPNKKRFEKAVKKNRYDLYALMASVWKEIVADRTREWGKHCADEVKELRAQLEQAKQEGLTALAETELSKRVKNLMFLLEEEQNKTAQLQAMLKTNGENKMAEITQWEYKTLETTIGDSKLPPAEPVALIRHKWPATSSGKPRRCASRRDS